MTSQSSLDHTKANVVAECDSPATDDTLLSLIENGSVELTDKLFFDLLKDETPAWLAASRGTPKAIIVVPERYIHIKTISLKFLLLGGKIKSAFRHVSQPDCIFGGTFNVVLRVCRCLPVVD